MKGCAELPIAPRLTSAPLVQAVGPLPAQLSLTPSIHHVPAPTSVASGVF